MNWKLLNMGMTAVILSMFAELANPSSCMHETIYKIMLTFIWIYVAVYIFNKIKEKVTKKISDGSLMMPKT